MITAFASNTEISGNNGGCHVIFKWRKDELSRHQTLARHCQIAEIAAIISMCGGVSISEKDHYSLKIQTENVYVARKYFTLLKKHLI